MTATYTCSLLTYSPRLRMWQRYPMGELKAWNVLSQTARTCIQSMLTADPVQRLSAWEALTLPFMSQRTRESSAGSTEALQVCVLPSRHPPPPGRRPQALYRMPRRAPPPYAPPYFPPQTPRHAPHQTPPRPPHPSRAYSHLATPPTIAPAGCPVRPQDSQRVHQRRAVLDRHLSAHRVLRRSKRRRGCRDSCSAAAHRSGRHAHCGGRRAAAVHAASTRSFRRI